MRTQRQSKHRLSYLAPSHISLAESLPWQNSVIRYPRDVDVFSKTEVKGHRAIMDLPERTEYDSCIRLLEAGQIPKVGGLTELVTSASEPVEHWTRRPPTKCL